MIRHVLADVTKMIDTTQGLIERVGLFGSATRRVSGPNDVDLVLRVEPGSETIVAQMISALSFSIPVVAVNVATYRARHEPIGGLGYHLLILGDAEARRAFDAYPGQAEVTVAASVNGFGDKRRDLSQICHNRHSGGTTPRGNVRTIHLVTR